MVEAFPDDALGTAATDIYHQASFVTRGQPARHPEIHQARLFATTDDLDRVAQCLLCGAQGARCTAGSCQ